MLHVLEGGISLSRQYDLQAVAGPLGWSVQEYLVGPAGGSSNYIPRVSHSGGLNQVQVGWGRPGIRVPSGRNYYGCACVNQ